jgi:hypothetical protein
MRLCQQSCRASDRLDERPTRQHVERTPVTMKFRAVMPINGRTMDFGDLSFICLLVILTGTARLIFLFADFLADRLGG